MSTSNHSYQGILLFRQLCGKSGEDLLVCELVDGSLAVHRRARLEDLRDTKRPLDKTYRQRCL